LEVGGREGIEGMAGRPRWPRMSGLSVSSVKTPTRIRGQKGLGERGKKHEKKKRGVLSAPPRPSLRDVRKKT